MPSILQLDETGEPSAIALFDGTGEIVLSVLDRQTSLTPNRDYALNNGWVAYTKPGASGQHQVWSLQVEGSPAQRTFFSRDSWLIVLNKKGELVFQSDEIKYFSHPNGVFYSLGEINGDIFWLDGGWKVILGRTLFALDTGEAPLIKIHGIVKSDSGNYYLSLDEELEKSRTLQSSKNLTDWEDVRQIDPVEELIDLGIPDSGTQSSNFHRVVVK